MFSQKRVGELLKITNTRPEHARQADETIRLAYRIPLDVPCDDCVNEASILSHIERFPEGQFVAIIEEDGEEVVVGVACTMRTSYPPTSPPLSWMEMMGGSTHIPNHEPNGEWLYGVEMAVRPNYRKLGIGTALYEARFDLVKRLKLRGWYAGGSLMGYHRYQDQLSVREYGEKVIRGEIIDPTVTMQKNRGFQLIRVIENYINDEYHSGNGAVLILWPNPDATAPE